MVKLLWKWRSNFQDLWASSSFIYCAHVEAHTASFSCFVQGISHHTPKKTACMYIWLVCLNDVLLFIYCIPHQILCEWSNQEEWDRWDVQQVSVRGEVESVLVRNLKERDEFEDLGVDGRIILKKIFKQSFGRVWTWFIWLMTGTSCRILWTQCWTFGFRKVWGIRILEKVLAFQGLYSTKLLIPL